MPTLRRMASIALALITQLDAVDDQLALLVFLQA